MLSIRLGNFQGPTKIEPIHLKINWERNKFSIRMGNVQGSTKIEPIHLKINWERNKQQLLKFMMKWCIIVSNISEITTFWNGLHSACHSLYVFNVMFKVFVIEYSWPYKCNTCTICLT